MAHSRIPNLPDNDQPQHMSLSDSCPPTENVTSNTSMKASMIKYTSNYTAQLYAFITSILTSTTALYSIV